MAARRPAQPVTLNVSPPLPEIAPLGTQARADVAREMFPGISDTDAAVVALSSQVVQLEEHLAQANARIDALKETMTKLVAYVTERVTTATTTALLTPAKVGEVGPTPEPTSIKATFTERPAKAQPKAQAVVVPSPQATAKVAATPPPPVAHTLNVGPKVVATFESFLKKGLDFSPLKVEGIDAKLAQPSAAYLRDAAHAYLSTYQGTSAYVQKVAAISPTHRSVPQLRGVLNSMFSLYVRAQKNGR